MDYENLPADSYTFEVKAKDEAGNISPVVSRVITVGRDSLLNSSHNKQASLCRRYRGCSRIANRRIEI